MLEFVEFGQQRFIILAEGQGVLMGFVVLGADELVRAALVDRDMVEVEKLLLNEVHKRGSDILGVAEFMDLRGSIRHED